MYHAELGRFMTRDPLPQEGVPDVLYDNNEFGRWLDMMKNLYGYVGDNPVTYTDSTGLDRTVYFCGHAWIEVDNWDCCGKKIGTLRLDFAPGDWTVLGGQPGAAHYSINSAETSIYFKLAGRHYASTPEQDKELVEAWKLLEKTRKKDGGVLNWGVYGNNCWIPVWNFGNYGGSAGPAKNPPPPPTPTDWYGPAGSGGSLGSY